MLKLLREMPISRWEKVAYGVVILVLGGLYLWRSNLPQSPAGAPVVEQQIEYETIAPKLSESFSVRKFLGRVNSNDYVKIHPRREGIVKDILVDTGDSVYQGQTLAVLLPPGVDGLSEASIARAYAELVAARDAWNNVQSTSRDAVALAEQGLNNLALSDEVQRSALDQQIATSRVVGEQVFQSLQKLVFGENMRVEYASGLLGSFNNSRQENVVLSLFKSVNLELENVRSTEESVYVFLRDMEDLTGELKTLYDSAYVSGNFSESKIAMNRTAVQGAETKILQAIDMIDGTRRQLSMAEQNLNLVSSRANSDLDAARTRLEMAQAMYQAELSKSGNIEVKSPFSGVITGKFGEVGEMVSPMKKLFEMVGADTSLGQKVVQEVQFDVSEDFLSEVEIGDLVQVNIPGQNVAYQASVTRKSSALNSASNTAVVYAELHASEVPHNTRVQVLLNQEDSPVLSLPSSVLKRKGNENFLWVERNGEYYYVSVEVLAEDGEFSDIVSQNLSLAYQVVREPSVRLWRVSHDIGELFNVEEND